MFSFLIQTTHRGTHFKKGREEKFASEVFLFSWRERGEATGVLASFVLEEEKKGEGLECNPIFGFLSLLDVLFLLFGEGEIHFLVPFKNEGDFMMSHFSFVSCGNEENFKLSANLVPIGKVSWNIYLNNRFY